jgi:hypothetical protein
MGALTQVHFGKGEINNPKCRRQGTRNSSHKYKEKVYIIYKIALVKGNQVTQYSAE